MRRWFEMRSTAVLVGVGLLAAACGSSVASTGTGDGPSPAATSGDSGSTRPEDAMLAFAQCMREHGVDLPDPQFQEGGGAYMKVEIDPDDDDFQRADKACRHHMSGAVAEAPDIDPERIAEMEQRMLAFAECMRGQGIDFPDPQMERGRGGGFLFGGREEELSFDPKSREFQEAERACQRELPNFPGQDVGVPAEGGQ